MTSDTAAAPLVREMERMYEDCNYSAMTYFSAAKSAEFWSKAIVFWPAVASAFGALLVALDQPKLWGAIGAVAGAVAATASFVGGGDRKSSSYKDSAKRYTALRHRVRMELALAESSEGIELDEVVRKLRAEYESILSANEPVPDRFFKRASKRIDAKVLSYSVDETELG